MMTSCLAIFIAGKFETVLLRGKVKEKNKIN
jgi:hypothetical protein